MWHLKWLDKFKISRDDVQCAGLTKFSSNPRWYFKVKLTVTKFFLQSVFPSQYVLFMLFNSHVRHVYGLDSEWRIHLTSCDRSSYSIPLSEQNQLFHPVMYMGRHNCFRFRKYPSSLTHCFIIIGQSDIYDNIFNSLNLNLTLTF